MTDKEHDHIVEVTAEWAAQYRTEQEPKSRAFEESRRTGKSRNTERSERWIEQFLYNSKVRVAKAGGRIERVTAAQLRLKFEECGGICQWEGCTDTATEIDHIRAVARKGAHALSNFRFLCTHHNHSGVKYYQDRGATDDVSWEQVNLQRFCYQHGLTHPQDGRCPECLVEASQPVLFGRNRRVDR